MKCPNCQSENLDKAKFCKSCGQPLPKEPMQSAKESQPASSLLCPHCGAVIKAGIKFCSKCGRKIDSPTQAAPVQVMEPAPVQVAASVQLSKPTSVQSSKSTPVQISKSTPVRIRLSKSTPVQISESAPIQNPKQDPDSEDNTTFLSDSSSTPEDNADSDSIPSTEAEPTKSCKKCGNPLKPGAAFCSKCGTSISDTVKTSDDNTSKSSYHDSSSSTENSDDNTQKMPHARQTSIPIIIPAILLCLLFVGIGVFALNKAGIIQLPFLNKTEDSEKMKARTDETHESGMAKAGSSAKLEEKPSEEEISVNLEEILAPISDQVADGESKLNSEDYGGAEAALTEALTAYADLASKGDAGTDTLNPLAEKAFALYTKSVLKQTESWESQSVTAPLYQQIDGTLQSAINFANTLRESNLTITTNELDENYAGFPNRYKENYILTFNDLRTGENWSRTTAWQYMQDAASIGLVDKNNPDDPLTLRYAYALAWITQKDLSEGLNDSSVTAQDAISAILSIAENTDYNPVLMRDLALYYELVGDANRSSIIKQACSNVYTYLANNENIYLNASDLFVPGRKSSNASSTIALNDFWYFNDLGEYSPSNTNGISAAGRAQIRNIFINALNAL